MQQEYKVELGFAQQRLPWLIAAGAFVVYLVTLNHAATFGGLISLAKVVGWDWRPNLTTPLQILITFPVRFLPASIQLTALNLVAATCASLALGLLARCVALLPHDRTRDQRQFERSDYSLLSIRAAWIPPVLAAAVCGFQLSFWENAVVATGEALDVLIFAWLIQALLLYRLDENESRLSRFAIVYGLAVTNNYAMVVFFPLFCGALIWIKGLTFFRLKFILRMLGFGVLGLLLYLVLPAMATVTHDTGFSFWEMLRTYWGAQKNSIVTMPRVIVILLSLTSVLPVLFMGIRWPAQFGEVSQLGNSLTNLMTHVIHGVFLLACIYVAFDPIFSPRSLGGGRAAFLPIYFLGALTIGYCAGYFLLVFGAKPEQRLQWQRPSALRQLLNRAVVGVIWFAVVAVPAALVYKNLPVVWANTGSALSNLAALSAKSLPPEGALVLSDEPFRLYALEDELRKKSPSHKFLLVDTASLNSGGYHLFLRKKYPTQWPSFASAPNPRQGVPPGTQIALLREMAARMPVYYLHPSFGAYFEYFAMRPRGLVYELRPYATNSVGDTPLSSAEIAAADAFWKEIQQRDLDPLARRIPPAEFPTAPGKRVERPVTLEMYVGSYYSRTLNHLGVAIQRAGDLPKAAGYYELALKLNPMNAAAFLNLEYNRRYLAGNKEGGKPSESAEKRIAASGGSLPAVFAAHGPIEEPDACYRLAHALNQGNLPRQALQNIERTTFYTPENLSAQVISVALAVRASMTDLALQRIAELRNSSTLNRLSEDEMMDLINAEAWAYASRNDLAAAERVLKAAQARYVRQSTPWSTLFDIYLTRGQVTNALNLVDEQLKVQPNNIQALVNSAYLQMQLGSPSNALPLLDHALKISPKDERALLNRAIVNLKTGQLDAAQRDYDALYSGAGNRSPEVLFGLAETYFKKKRRKDALRLYRMVEEILPEEDAERQNIRERIKVLESGADL